MTPLQPANSTHIGDHTKASHLDIIKRLGWEYIGPVGEDAATRRNYRITKDGKTAVFTQYYGHTPGHDLKDFIRLSGLLNEAGVNAPDIYDCNPDENWLIQEDFGDTTFKKAFETESRAELYVLGAEVIKALRSIPSDDLPYYFDSFVHHGHPQVIDWYAPVNRGCRNEDGLRDAYLAVWDEIEKNLPPSSDIFIHADFHVENLMWLPERDGLQRCGVIDFQGAMKGSATYDLANLLEDARADIPQDIREAALAGYSAEDRLWYRVLATQFHCRVIGLFVKLPLVAGKEKYLEHLPRLAKYIDEALAHPVLAPLDKFFKENGISFVDSDPADMAKARQVIHPDLLS